MTFWRKWSGLPWGLGADPRDGRAACCFRTAQATREELGLPWPAELMKGWYAAAHSGDWDLLRRDWHSLTEPIEKPEAGALIRFDRGDGSFGIGVLPDERTLITVRHYGRLIVGPLASCGKMNLYRLQ